MRDWFLKYWLEVVFGTITGICMASYKALQNKLKRQNLEQEAIKLGIQALLRSEIIREYNKWIDLEYIPIYAMENVEAMYKQYHNLGGNGTITSLVEKLQNLSTERRKSKVVGKVEEK